MTRKHINSLVLVIISVFLSGGVTVQAAGYNPLEVSGDWTPQVVDRNINDTARSRDIPLRIYLPEQKTASPVVLFSHGLGGSCKNNPYLGNHWSGRGYVVVFVQHHGSDEAIWRDIPVDQVNDSIVKAASLQNFILRAQDIRIVLNNLENWNKQDDHVLHNRLDLDHIGMSGHSFGAITTQALCGQNMIGGKPLFTDPRIKAAVALSPSSPPMGTANEAFGQVKIPWLLMTGTKDEIWIGNIDLASRLAVYEALPPGDKYEVVLFNAEHSAFHESPIPGDKEQRNPNHHRVVLALSTAFWDAYLCDNSDAKQWLDGDGPLSVLQSQDTFKKK